MLPEDEWPAKIIHVRDRGGFWTPWMPELYKCTHVPFVLQTLLHLDKDILERTFKSPRKWHSCLLWAAAFAIRSQCLFRWIDCGALTSQHNLEPYSFLCDQQSNCWLSVWLLLPSQCHQKHNISLTWCFVTSTVYCVLPLPYLLLLVYMDPSSVSAVGSPSDSVRRRAYPQSLCRKLAEPLPTQLIILANTILILCYTSLHS